MIFSVENEEIELLNAHFRRICFCAQTDFLEVSNGCIQGKKDENGIWFIQGSVTVEYDFGTVPVKFDVQLEEG